MHPHIYYIVVQHITFVPKEYNIGARNIIFELLTKINSSIGFLDDPIFPLNVAPTISVRELPRKVPKALRKFEQISFVKSLGEKSSQLRILVNISRSSTARIVLDSMK